MISLIAILASTDPVRADLTMSFSVKDSVYANPVILLKVTLTQGDYAATLETNIVGFVSFISDKLKEGEPATVSINDPRFETFSQQVTVATGDTPLIIKPHMVIKLLFTNVLNKPAPGIIIALTYTNGTPVYFGLASQDGLRHIYLKKEFIGTKDEDFFLDYSDPNLQYYPKNTTFRVATGVRSHFKHEITVERFYFKINCSDVTTSIGVKNITVAGFLIQTNKTMKEIFTGSTNDKGLYLYSPPNNTYSIIPNEYQVIVYDANGKYQVDNQTQSSLTGQFSLNYTFKLEEKISVTLNLIDKNTKAIIPFQSLNVQLWEKDWLTVETDDKGTVTIPGRESHLMFNDNLTILLRNSTAYQDGVWKHTVVERKKTIVLEADPFPVRTLTLKMSKCPETKELRDQSNAVILFDNHVLFNNTPLNDDCTFKMQDTTAEKKLETGRSLAYMITMPGFERDVSHIMYDVVNKTENLEAWPIVNPTIVKFRLSESTFKGPTDPVLSSLWQDTVEIQSISDLAGGLTFSSKHNKPIDLGKQLTLKINSNKFQLFEKNFTGILNDTATDVTLDPYAAISMSFVSNFDQTPVGNLSVTVVTLEKDIVYQGSVYSGTKVLFLKKEYDSKIMFTVEARHTWLLFASVIKNVTMLGKKGEVKMEMKRNFFFYIETRDPVLNVSLSEIQVGALMGEKLLFANKTTVSGKYLQIVEHTFKPNDVIRFAAVDALKLYASVDKNVTVETAAQFNITVKFDMNMNLFMTVIFANLKTQLPVPFQSCSVEIKGQEVAKTSANEVGMMMLTSGMIPDLKLGTNITIKVTNDIYFKDQTKTILVDVAGKQDTLVLEPKEDAPVSVTLLAKDTIFYTNAPDVAFTLTVSGVSKELKTDAYGLLQFKPEGDFKFQVGSEAKLQTKSDKFKLLNETFGVTFIINTANYLRPVSIEPIMAVELQVQSATNNRPAAGVTASLKQLTVVLDSKTTDRTGKAVLFISNTVYKGTDTIVTIEIKDDKNIFEPVSSNITIPGGKTSHQQIVQVTEKQIVIPYKLKDTQLNSLVPFIRGTFTQGNFSVNQTADFAGNLIWVISADKVKLGVNYTIVINSSLFKRFEVTDNLVANQPFKEIKLDPILAMRLSFAYESTPVGGLMVALVHMNGTIIYSYDTFKNGQVIFFVEPTYFNGSATDFTVDMADPSNTYEKITQKISVNSNKYEQQFALKQSVTSATVWIKLTEKTFGTNPIGVKAQLVQESIAIEAMSDIGGNLIFQSTVFAKIINGKYATLYIIDDKYEAQTELFVVQNGTMKELSVMPLCSVRFTFVDEVGAPLKGIMATLSSQGKVIGLLQTLASGHITFHLNRTFAPLTGPVVVTMDASDTNVIHGDAQLNVSLELKQNKSESTVTMKEQSFISVKVTDSAATPNALKDIIVTVVNQANNKTIFNKTTDFLGTITWRGDPSAFNVGDTLSFIVADATLKWTPVVSNITVTKAKSVSTTFALKELTTITVKVSDSKTAVMLKDVWIEFYKGASLISYNQTNDKGVFMLTSMYAEIKVGDALTIKATNMTNYLDKSVDVTLSAFQTQVELQLVPSSDYSITITVIEEPTKTCEKAANVELKNNNKVIFARETDQNCKVTFRSKENELYKIGDILSYTVSAKDFKSSTGSYTIKVKEESFSVTLNPGSDGAIVTFKLVDFYYQASGKLVKGLLQTESMALEAVSDLFGNLIFKSQPGMPIPVNKPATITINSERFEPYNNTITVTDRYFEVVNLRPYQVMQFAFKNEKDANISNLMVAVTTRDKQIAVGLSDEFGKLYAFVDKATYEANTTEFFMSCTDTKFRYQEQTKNITLPLGTKNLTSSSKLIAQMSIAVQITDYDKKNLPGINVSLSSATQAYYQGVTDNVGTTTFHTTNFDIVKPGDVITITAVDPSPTPKYLTTVLNVTAPLDKLYVTQTLKMAEPLQFILTVVDESNKAVQDVMVKFTSQAGLDATIKSNEAGECMYAAKLKELNIGDNITATVTKDAVLKDGSTTFTLLNPKTLAVLKLPKQKVVKLTLKVVTEGCAPAQVSLIDNAAIVFQKPTEKCLVTFSSNENDQKLKVGGVYTYVATLDGYTEARGAVQMRTDAESVDVVMIKLTGMSTGAIVGIVIGAVAVVTAIAVFVVVLLRRPKTDSDLKRPLLAE